MIGLKEALENLKGAGCHRVCQREFRYEQRIAERLRRLLGGNSVQTLRSLIPSS